MEHNRFSSRPENQQNKSQRKKNSGDRESITWFCDLDMEKEHDCCHSNATVIAAFSLMIVIRVFYVIYLTGKPLSSKSSKPRSTLIVLGSGGHTAEMIDLVSGMRKDRYTPRFYIAATTDNMSLQKAQVLEASLIDDEDKKAPAQFMQIYRSREVGQSYITSIGTTLIAIAHALWLMLRIRPEVILCNGPGTCIPLCMIAFLFKVMGIRWSSIFYVESIARVKKLSLSGLLLYRLHIADQFFVQWPQLQTKYPRAHYVGCLM
ncbi:UDP-N-acetylglucosamine transferase subunit ALG14 homolog [Linum perenne]